MPNFLPGTKSSELHGYCVVGETLSHREASAGFPLDSQRGGITGEKKMAKTPLLKLMKHKKKTDKDVRPPEREKANSFWFG